jgi:hypothetical protein
MPGDPRGAPGEGDRVHPRPVRRCPDSEGVRRPRLQTVWLYACGVDSCRDQSRNVRWAVVAAARRSRIAMTAILSFSLARTEHRQTWHCVLPYGHVVEFGQPCLRTTKDSVQTAGAVWKVWVHGAAMLVPGIPARWSSCARKELSNSAHPFDTGRSLESLSGLGGSEMGPVFRGLRGNGPACEQEAGSLGRIGDPCL